MLAVSLAFIVFVQSAVRSVPVTLAVRIMTGYKPNISAAFI